MFYDSYDCDSIKKIMKQIQNLAYWDTTDDIESHWINKIFINEELEYCSFLNKENNKILESKQNANVNKTPYLPYYAPDNNPLKHARPCVTYASTLDIIRNVRVANLFSWYNKKSIMTNIQKSHSQCVMTYDLYKRLSFNTRVKYPGTDISI